MSRRRDEGGGLPWLVVLPMAALLAVGVVFVRSAAGDDRAIRQLVFVAAGCVASIVVLRVGVRRLAELSFAMYAGLLVLLVVLPFVGTDLGTGSVRWLGLPFGFNLQPSELMKVGLVLALARYLQHRGVTNTWRSYAMPFVLGAVPWYFVMRQPDLGSSLVLLPLAMGMVTVSGARMRHVFALAGATAGLVLAAYHVPGILLDYQKQRLDAFMTPVPQLVAQAREQRIQREHDAAREVEQELLRLKQGTGYQQFYSVVAIGSGGLDGAGLGKGLQNHLNRLPVRESDFIFAVIGEEWGLAGTSFVVFLYWWLLSAILGVARDTREPFGRLVCVGVAAMLGSQALMNLGIATGLLPVTGLPLPFISYGGSSVLASMLAVACVADVARRREAVFFES